MTKSTHGGLHRQWVSGAKHNITAGLGVGRHRHCWALSWWAHLPLCPIPTQVKKIPPLTTGSQAQRAQAETYSKSLPELGFELGLLPSLKDRRSPFP